MADEKTNKEMFGITDKISMEAMSAILDQVVFRHFDNLKKDFIALGLKVDALTKEVSESRQHLLVRVEELEGKLNTYEVSALKAQEKANDAQKEAGKVAVAADKKMADCREGESLRIKDGASKIPPRMSWKQVLSACVIYVIFGGFIMGFNYYTLNSMKETIKENGVIVTRVEQSLVEHITHGIKP
jgi:hypothetical protein